MDTTTPRSRRAILASALGGLGAIAAARLVKPEAASANPGDPVTIDATTAGVGTTGITSIVPDADALHVSGDGSGITGIGTLGVGVTGTSNNVNPSDFANPSHLTGIIGSTGNPVNIATNTDEVGVYGYADLSTGSSGVWGDSNVGTGVAGSGDTGVFGAGYYGVYAFGRVAVTGDGGATDTGVYGFAGANPAPLPPAGVGVQATAGSTAQIALNVTGKAKFSRSGKTFIGAGLYARKVTMAGVTTSSYVIATLQTRRVGVYVHAVVPGTGYFYIYLNKAVTATTYVGYLVIN
jgi:hypothetical protein